MAFIAATGRLAGSKPSGAGRQRSRRLSEKRAHGPARGSRV